jgi:hypothetical protein
MMSVLIQSSTDVMNDASPSGSHARKHSGAVP